ncbi:SRP40, C-terminal domain-containing protein [Pholiota molesta]|nr:SRP40, C-terminal domain-containing protein [Pholiota molesta]
MKDATPGTKTAATPFAALENVEEGQAVKKRRTAIDGSSVVTTFTSNQQEETQSASARIKGGNGKHGRQINERFKRVDPSKVEPIQNNSYVAKIGPQNDYGKRAHEDLIVTRGAGFRKEKNKKKRGSYKGGEITVSRISSSRSFFLIKLYVVAKSQLQILICRGITRYIYICASLWYSFQDIPAIRVKSESLGPFLINPSLTGLSVWRN